MRRFSVALVFTLFLGLSARAKEEEPILDGPASPFESGRAFFEPGRAGLEPPENLWREALSDLGFDGRALGFTAEEMANYGSGRHLLPAVDRLFRDVRAAPRLGGRVSESLLGRPGDLLDAVRTGYRLLDVSAGRGIVAPEEGDWGVGWIAPGAGVNEAFRALNPEQIHPEQWEALPEAFRRLVVRVLIGAFEARQVLGQAHDAAHLRKAVGNDGSNARVLHLFATEPWREDRPRRASFETLDRFDPAYMAYGTLIFLAHAEAAIREWRAAAPEVVSDFVGVLGFRTPVGTVLLSGTSDDSLENAGTDFVFDLGGDDVYSGGALAAPSDLGRPVSVLIDLGGDDVYRSGDDGPGMACGSFGVGFLADLDGNDRYRAGNSGLGAAWYGTGVLVDYAGDDDYSGGRWTLGAAHAGLGLLIDLAGDDRYACDSESQGFGGTRGVGILLDHAGDDEYVARPDGNISETFRGKTVSFAQGAAFGRRADFGDGKSLAGGIGMLCDGSGDDTYAGGVYCQGAGYWWGAGFLEDHAGNDRYSSIQYSLGSAPHMAVGCCVDLAGDDEYNLDTPDLYMQSQGCARDGSIGVFIDGEGDDRYRNGNRSAGSGEINAIGLFWDRSGNDSYEAVRSTPSPSTPPYGVTGAHRAAPGSFRALVPAAGLFLDTGGSNLYQDEFTGDPASAPLLAAGGGEWRHSERPGQRSLGIDRALLMPVPEPEHEDDALSVHRFETICNTYFLTAKQSRRFVVIDPAVGCRSFVQAWIDRGLELEAIWITHEHFDHLTGLSELAVSTDVPILCHPNAKDGIAEAIRNWENWGFAEVSPRPVLPTGFLVDGEVRGMGGLRLETRYAPGHSRGSLLYLVNGTVLFAGDVLFKGSVGRTDLGGSDRERFCRALATRIWDLTPEVVVFPGHMERTTIAEEKETNWLLQDYVRHARGEPPIPRPWVGIRIDREREAPGLLLTAVTEGSPAETAGLSAGDVVLRFGGADMGTIQDLLVVLRRAAVGDRIPLVIQRDGEERTILMVLGTRPR